MKILLCGSSMGIGGAETHMLSLAIGLVKKGHRVAVVAERGELCKELKKNKIRFISAPLSENNILSIIRSYKTLRRVIQQEKFDVVHAHSRLSAYLVEKIRKHEGMDFHFVVTAHAKYKTNQAYKLMSAWGDECIAVSRDIKAHLIKEYGVDPKRLSVIPNGIDTDRFYPAHNGKKQSVLFVSRLDRDCSMGAKLLCEAAPELVREFPHIKITVAGGGEDYCLIKRIAQRANKSLGKKAISLLGECVDIKPVLERNECVVGVSRVALEAMSMKKKVVLFGNEGALGLLSAKCLKAASGTNFTCRGYKRNINKSFLIREIRRALTLDEKSRRQMETLLRKTVTEEYSTERMADMTLNVYKNRARCDLRILIGGYYGFGNLGDESILNVLVKGLRSSLPTCKIRALTKGKGRRGVIPRGDPFALVKGLEWSNVYICGGGSLFQNVTSTRSLIYYCALIYLAKRKGNRIIIFSNGIGPIHGRLAEALTCEALMKADYVSVRDLDSFFKVLSLTKGKVRPYLSADPVFSSELNKTCRSDQGKSIMDFGGKYVAVALNGRTEKVNDILSHAIKIYCLSKGMLPVFVSMDTEADINSSRKGARICNGIMIEDNNMEALGSVLKNSEIAIGSRLHFLIYALRYGVKVVPINVDPKINAFSNEVLSSRAIDISSHDSCQRALNKINAFLRDNYSEFDDETQKGILEEMKLRASRDIKRLSFLCERVDEGRKNTENY